MSIEVKVGQVWRDKDKRRNTVIEIIDARVIMGNVKGLIVGTEIEKEYKVERLLKRWLLVSEKAEKPAKKIKESKYKTREQWLEAAVKEVSKSIFAPKNIEVPAVRVSVGWPGGRGKKQGVVGQCFASFSSTDKVAQIFVSPAVDKTLSVLATLTHELVHAVDDCKSGHKKDFIKIAREIGFEAEWTSSENRTDALTEKLQAVAEKLGEFPHAAIRQEERPTTQPTYMRKLTCAHDDDYKLRMTRKMLDEYGAPICPCHREEMIEA